MRLNEEQIKLMLGYPVISVELTSKQLKAIIAYTTEQVKTSNPSETKMTKDFMFNKLVIINAKRVWKTIFTKWIISNKDKNQLNNLNWLDEVEREESNFLNLL